MSSKIANRDIDTHIIWAERFVTIAVSIVLMGIALGMVYATGWGLSLPLRTSVDNGVYLALGMIIGLWLLDVAKVNLEQGDLTKMDVVSVLAMTVVGTHVYVSLTNGVLFTGAYLSLAVALIVRLLLIVVARDIIKAIRFGF